MHPGGTNATSDRGPWRADTFMRLYSINWQLLLLVLAASSLQQSGLQLAAASSTGSRPRALFQDVQTPALVDTPQEQHPSGPIYRKSANGTSTAADVAAPASVTMLYRDPGQGKCGRWDNFDYQDDRNINPRRYCPRSCRQVSSRIARCQCVTRASLNAFYSGRRWGRTVYPECCYLTPPGGGGGGGGCGWGGCPPDPPPNPPPTPPPNPPPSPNMQQTWTTQTYTIGSCTQGGLGVISNSLKAFLATLPGVAGSTVDVRTSATMQPLPKANSVVAASLQKSQEAQAKMAQAEPAGVSAQFIFHVPNLPASINVSAGVRVRVRVGWGGGGGEVCTVSGIDWGRRARCCAGLLLSLVPCAVGSGRAEEGGWRGGGSCRKAQAKIAQVQLGVCLHSSYSGWQTCHQHHIECGFLSLGVGREG